MKMGWVIVVEIGTETIYAIAMIIERYVQNCMRRCYAAWNF